MKKFVVIMAGGVGARFWPRSRKAMPKQMLNIFGENTMIQDTISRLDGFVEPENIFIITNKIQKAIIEEQLPQLPFENVIAEPVGRNTAPCVGLASVIINKKIEDGVIVTLPADHLISPKEDFISALNKGCDHAYNSKGLITFGIEPTRPDTGYGYINFDKTEISENIHRVIKFVEKPDKPTAEQYLSSGDYLWNSGMFIWRADVILDEIKNHLPDMYAGLSTIAKSIDENNFEEVLKQQFPLLQSISIDYGIMEKSDKVFLVKGKFNWSDVGSWETVYDLTKKDENNVATVGDIYVDKSSNSYIYSKDKFTAAIGVDNLIIINTEDSLLVCNRDNVQDVRDVVDYLKDNNKNGLF